jgi:CRISPR/Cas system-associated exonuclease Cas4 (RecB family)
MTYTASARERVQHCPASASLPQIHTTSEWAQTGNDGHEAMCAFVSQLREGMSLDAALVNVPDEWAPLCESLAPLAPHLRPELALAMSLETSGARVLGENLKRRYDLIDGEIAGTADLAGVIDGVAIVVDLKTGYGKVTHPERNPQLAMLALMAARAWGCDSARIAIIVGRESSEPRWQWHHLECWDLDAIASELIDEARQVAHAVTVVQSGGVPNVNEGEHCRYCPATPVCPAKSHLIRRLASGAEGDELELLIPLDARTAGIAWERLGMARAMLNRIEAACRAYLEEHGQLELPNGKLLKQVTVDGHERLDGDEVYNVALQLCGPAVADASVQRTATKKALEEATRAAFGRGGAAKARHVLEEVRKRGGASRGKTTKLIEVEPERKALP